MVVPGEIDESLIVWQPQPLMGILFVMAIPLLLWTVLALSWRRASLRSLFGLIAVEAVLAALLLR